MYNQFLQLFMYLCTFWCSVCLISIDAAIDRIITEANTIVNITNNLYLLVIIIIKHKIIQYILWNIK